MAGQTDNEVSASQPNSQDTIRALVLEFLELLPETMKRVIHISAIPHAFTPELVQVMSDEKDRIAESLETLQENYFVNKGEGNWYYYSSGIREILLTFWQQPEQIQEFQRANQVAIAYFDNLANRTNPPGSYVFQREALYHRLLENEHAGLEYMADLFERACDQHQIGVAQNLSMQLTQTLPQLSPMAGQYALFYEMRLDFLLHRREKMEEKLGTLMGETSDPLLKARIGILLGQVWLTKYEWKKSTDILKASLEVLKKLESWRYVARAMLVLGDIYIDLVENSGGVQSETSNDLSPLSRFLNGVVFLPFLVLDWLRRKIWFLPGWFYFSGNYQEWILNYLLQMAGTWYRKAWRMAQRAADDTASLSALLGQANVAVQQRREAKARRIYSELVELPGVHSSQYRLAQVLFGQGQVFMLANRSMQARQDLQIALDIFQSFADEANIATVARALGTTYLQLGDSESAARRFLESIRAYKKTQDTVSQTQVSWELERLIEQKQTSSSIEQEIKEALSEIQVKQYIARFPSDLLRRFRTLAYWVTLPLSYLLIVFFSLVTCLSLIAIEWSALQFSSTGRLSQSDIFFLMVIGILPIFLTFWIIELVYAILGQAWVFVAGRNSLNSLGQQPDRVILTSEAVFIDSPGLREPKQLAWDEIQKLISADQRLWQRPIKLFSRQAIVGGNTSIVIDGITTGYTQLRKEIIRKVGGVVRQLDVNVVLLAHRTAYIALLVALLHAQLLVSVGQIEITVESGITGEMHQLFLSRLLVFFLVNLLMIFPPLILWRVHLQRRFFSRQLRKRPRRLLNIVSFGIAIVLSITAILWLVISPVLKINGG
jgi:tetratricopeptide (TPR) repeat protein